MSRLGRSIAIASILIFTALLAVSPSCQGAGHTWDVEVADQPEQAALSVDAVFSILMLDGDRITGCTLTIRNTTEAPVTIRWDESALVQQDETIHRLTGTDMLYVEGAELQAPGLIPPGAAIQGVVWPASPGAEPIRIEDGDRIQLLLPWSWHEDQEQRSQLWEWQFIQRPLPEEPGDPMESPESEEPTAANWWLIGTGVLALAALGVLLLTGAIPPLW